MQLDPLAYVDCDPWSAKLRFDAANANGYDAYWRWARVFDADQDFWYPLLAASISEDSTALIFESRLGMLSVALSSEYETVLSVHSNPAAAALTKSLLGRRGINNVRTIVIDDPERLEIQDSLDAVVVFGLEDDLTGQWKGVIARVYSHALSLASKWLVQKGQFVLCANNRWSYKHPSRLDRAGYMAMPLALRDLRKSFQKTIEFVGSSDLVGSHSPPPDLEARDQTSQQFAQRGVLARLKRMLIGSRLFKGYWPSFMVIASRVDVDSRVASALRQWREDGNGAEFQAQRLRVRRFIAGNHGITIMILNDLKSSSPGVVLRLARSAVAKQYWLTNANALESLEESAWRQLSPKLLWRSESKDQFVSIETECVGLEKFANEQGFILAMPPAVEWLSRLHAETSSWAEFSDEDYSSLISSTVDDLAQYCSSSLALRLASVNACLRENLVGKSVCRGIVHGDFKLGNILFDQQGMPTAIIDWDGFDCNGIQVFDYLTLGIYMLTHDFELGHDGAFLEYLLDWKLPERYEACVGGAIKRFCPDPHVFLLLRIGFWFNLLKTRYAATYKYHPTWRVRHVDTVLPRIESILQSTQFAGHVPIRPVCLA